MLRSDGKRLDGIILVPWKCSQLLVWDVTCPDIYAPTYFALAGVEAGHKRTQYHELDSVNLIVPLAIETY